MSMKHFLLVFDRSQGELRRLTEFSTRSEALEARFDTEKLYREQPQIEVVVLTASAEEDLRRTHARYFEDVRQMVSDGLERVSRARQLTLRGGGPASGLAV